LFEFAKLSSGTSQAQRQHENNTPKETRDEHDALPTPAQDNLALPSFFGRIFPPLVTGWINLLIF